MLMKILDALGVSQTVTVNAQEALVDASGSIAVTGVSQIAAPASVNRAGFFLQNNGSNVMWFNELGAATAGAGSVKIPIGGTLSTSNGYPLTTGALNLIGTVGDAYTLRIW